MQKTMVSNENNSNENKFLEHLELLQIPDYRFFYPSLIRQQIGKDKHSKIKGDFKVSGKQTAWIEKKQRKRYPKYRIDDQIPEERHDRTV